MAGPRTVAGLLAELETSVDDAAVLAAAMLDYGRQLRRQAGQPRTDGAPPGTGRRNGTDSRRRGAVVTRPSRPVTVSAAISEAAQLAIRLHDALRAAPAVLGALGPLTRPPKPVTSPLYIPDVVDDLVVRDAGTGVVNTDPYVGIVPWWPQLPPAARAVDMTLFDVRPDELQLIGNSCEHYAGGVSRSQSTPARELILCAQTLQMVRNREAGYDRLARSIVVRADGNDLGAKRRAIRTISTTYRLWAEFLAPLADMLAARYAQYLQSLTDALSALSIAEGLDMPTLTTAPAVITSLATRIRDAITTGHGGRLQVSDAEQAFAWNVGPAVSLLSYLATDTVSGRRTTVVQAKDSATPVVPTDEGAAKPNVVDFTSSEVDLVKYPGQARISVESSQFVNNIETAVASVITGQIVRAIEVDAAGAIDTDAGVVVTGAADITAGVLAAIAGIRSNGGAPNVVGLNASDWIEVMQATGAGGYLNFSNPEAGPAGTWLGLAPVIIPSLTAGNAIVADGRAVTVSEPVGGPLCIVDPFTEAKNNKIVITIEAWAVPAVTSPGGVATVAVVVTP